MVRRYEEPIEVSTTTRGLAVGALEADPQVFIWRGRLYAVQAVQERWAERRAWWRERSDPPPEAPERAAGPQASERRVWRVEAASGRSAATGVFDLGLDGTDERGPWVLLRAHD